MRKWTWVLAGYVCLSISPVATAVDEPGTRGGLLGRGGAGQAAAQSRATSRLNAAEGRPVGANFGANRSVGASAAAGSTGREGAAGIRSRSELRGAGRFASQAQPLRGERPEQAEPLARGQVTKREKGHPGVHPQQDRLVQQAETNLTRRLASIDRMRDQALENGDSAMLAKADQLEQLTRLQHEQRIAQVTAFETGQPSSERTPMGAQVRNIFATPKPEIEPQPETSPTPLPQVDTDRTTDFSAGIAE
jgi:hypothetical protein